MSLSVATILLKQINLAATRTSTVFKPQQLQISGGVACGAITQVKPEGE
jgi:hypothetical protein